MRTRLNFRQPISDDLYRGFLAHSRKVAQSLCVITEDAAGTSGSASELLRQLDPWLLSKTLVREWPGTRIEDPDDTALRCEYRFTDAVVDLMIGATSNIYCWRSPQLPEDPHLLRADGSLWFGATTTEEWSWLEPFPEELEELLDALPAIGDLLLPADPDVLSC